MTKILLAKILKLSFLIIELYKCRDKMAKKIKVLRVITRLPIGGIERRLVAILPRLNDDEFEVSICCLKERGELADELEKSGVKVILIPSKSRLHPRSIFALADFMKREEIDIVHSHMYRSNVPATIAASLAGVRVNIAQIHNVDTWETQRQRLMDSFLCRWRDLIIAVSQNVRHDILKNLSIPPEKCEVLYNGVEAKNFNKHFDKIEIKKSLGIAQDKIVISIVARLVDQKNHKGFLETAQLLSEEYDNLIFLIVGDGKLKDGLVKQTEDLGISDKVKFLGNRDDIAEILSITDISVLTSFKEGFSNTIVESLASGVPVVASDVGGNAEAVEDGKNGFIIEPNTPELTAEKLSYLIEDKKLRNAMSEAALISSKEFSIDLMIEKTKEIYRRLYKEKV